MASNLARKGFLVLLLLIIPWAVCNATPYLEALTEKDPLYSEALAAASAWKGALLDRNTDTLLLYAPPELREKIRDELKNRKSDLYRLFYDAAWNRRRGSRSFQQILKAAKRLRIFMQKSETQGTSSVQGVDIFYYDEGKAGLKFPLDMKDVEYGRLQQAVDEGRVLYMLFFKKDGRWYANYELFE
ncbi:MAG TPA: hypothetical protein VF790_05855 [Dissulfurispiraceae bacterium]